MTGEPAMATWDPLSIANGDFQGPGDENSPVPTVPDVTLSNLPGPLAKQLQSILDALAKKNLVPGWSDHGGGGAGHVVDGSDGQVSPTDYALELIGPYGSKIPGFINFLKDFASGFVAGSFAGNISEARRVHNNVYVPTNAGFVEFDLQTFATTSADRFVVMLGDRVLDEPLVLSSQGPSQETVRLAIPKDLRGLSLPLTFEILPDTSDPFGQVNSRVRIDNVQFRADYFYTGRTGDLIGVDLRSVLGGASFAFADQMVAKVNGTIVAIVPSGPGR